MSNRLRTQMKNEGNLNFMPQEILQAITWAKETPKPTYTVILKSDWEQLPSQKSHHDRWNRGRPIGIDRGQGSSRNQDHTDHLPNPVTTSRFEHHMPPRI